MRLADLRQAIADQLITIPGLSVSMYRPGLVDAPHAVISIGSGRYDSTMARGSDAVTMQILLYVTRADDADALGFLDEYVTGHGDRSIKTAVERASGDGLSYCRVTGYEVGTASIPDGSEYLAATFEVEAVISGTA